MNLQSKKLNTLILSILLSLGSFAQAKGLVFSDSQIFEIGQIAKDISALNPKLPKMKNYEYAIGIFDACEHYGIDPQLLISITQQESSFRSDLKEGAAGELGMTQIRKNWLENKEFRTEFPAASEMSLKMPAMSFLYSAWLLSHLKISEVRNKLPYWTYYNARGFAPRLRYFKRVNSKLSKIRQLRKSRLASFKFKKREIASQKPAPAAKVAKVSLTPKLAPKKIRSVTKLSSDGRLRAIRRAEQRKLAALHAQRQAKALQALRKQKIAPILAVAKIEEETQEKDQSTQISFEEAPSEGRVLRTRVQVTEQTEVEQPQNTYLSSALETVKRDYQKRQERYEATGVIPADFYPRNGSAGYIAPAVSSTAQELGLTNAY